MQRFVSIWFPFLKANWVSRRKPGLADMPVAFIEAVHGRMTISAVNKRAAQEGISTGMVVADARAVLPGLQVINDREGRSQKLLTALAEWFIRFSPAVAVDGEDGLLMDVTGCCHLWGGEPAYLNAIQQKMNAFGYDIRLAMADTIAAAWSLARYGENECIAASGAQQQMVEQLPVSALRLQPGIADQLRKLGLYRIGQLWSFPQQSLSRRFGKELLQQLNYLLGTQQEYLQPIVPVAQYTERLPCMEPIVYAAGVEIAITRVLQGLCDQLQKAGKGLRTAVLTIYRVDHGTQTISISTTRATHQFKHLFKLFELKIAEIAPGLGIELFVLTATVVEKTASRQEDLWLTDAHLQSEELAGLLDRIVIRFGSNSVHRYLPAAHHWPERSYTKAKDLQETTLCEWRTDRIRPPQLLTPPARIEVTAPIPDYPPMLFRYKGNLHKVVKADGPERIEQEWWLATGEHRDYYYVEDEQGIRYWLFRLGHYDTARPAQWYLHGYFA